MTAVKESKRIVMSAGFEPARVAPLAPEASALDHSARTPCYKLLGPAATPSSFRGMGKADTRRGPLGHCVPGSHATFQVALQGLLSRRRVFVAFPLRRATRVTMFGLGPVFCVPVCPFSTLHREACHVIMLHKVERNPTHSGHGQRAVNGACPPVIPKRGRNGSGLFISKPSTSCAHHSDPELGRTRASSAVSVR
jgi:hypothetical protein